jgi:hypothetical protein
MAELSPLWLATTWGLSCETLLFAVLYPLHKWPRGKKASHVFFNPQDYAASETAKTGGVPFPEETKAATFEPFIAQYTGMAKVTIALAAASISFGGVNTTNPQIWTAKLLLSYSIAFSLLFCVFMINFYENYLHDLKSYKPWLAALVESCGVTSLVCFGLGYWYWARHL